MDDTTCKQDNCNNVATYRFTWPGKNESFICEKCSKKLLAIATAIGLHVQLILLKKDG